MILVISAATCWLSCSLSPHLYCGPLAAVCELKSVLPAWLWVVGEAAICQLGCDMSAQLPLVHFAVSSVELVSLTVSSAAPCSSDVIYHLTSDLSPPLHSAIAAAVCQLSCIL